jgi:hypothetical protein
MADKMDGPSMPGKALDGGMDVLRRRFSAFWRLA